MELSYLLKVFDKFITHVKPCHNGNNVTGKNELISFKIVINEVAETYGITPSAAALRVTNIISDYNKKGQLERELSELSLQKYAINEFCSSRSKAIHAVMNLRNHGITEQHIISLNNFLANNEYNINST